MNKCFLKSLWQRHRHKQGIIQEFNLGVGSHVSITFHFVADRGEGAWGGLYTSDNSVSLTLTTVSRS